MANNVPGIVVSDYTQIKRFISENAGEFGRLNHRDTVRWIPGAGAGQNFPLKAAKSL